MWYRSSLRVKIHLAITEMQCTVNSTQNFPDCFCFTRSLLQFSFFFFFSHSGDKCVLRVEARCPNFNLRASRSVWKPVRFAQRAKASALRALPRVARCPYFPCALRVALPRWTQMLPRSCAPLIQNQKFKSNPWLLVYIQSTYLY